MERSTEEARQGRREAAEQLVAQLTGVPLIPLDSRAATEAVCRRYRHHAVQYYFDEKVLEMTRQNLEPDVAYFIEDAFLVRVVLFLLDGTPYLLGPFCAVMLTEREAIQLMKRLSLDLATEPFLVYRNSIPQMSDTEAERVMRAVVGLVEPGARSKFIRRIRHEASEAEARAEEMDQKAHHGMIVEQRYETEKRFLEAVRAGDTREAMRQHYRLRRDVAYMRRLGTPMEAYRSGANISRAMVRITAVQAGLPAVIVDGIASASNRELWLAKTPDEVLDTTDRMIRSFCEAIRNMRERRYSAAVMTAIYRIEHDFEKPLRMADLAEDLNISESYLASRFKKEVGVSPSAYLTRTRMQKAALLLSGGSLSVSGVSGAVGILDANYFVKLFKKEFGETPSEYRRRHTS